MIMMSKTKIHKLIQFKSMMLTKLMHLETKLNMLMRLTIMTKIRMTPS